VRCGERDNCGFGDAPAHDVVVARWYRIPDSVIGAAGGCRERGDAAPSRCRPQVTAGNRGQIRGHIRISEPRLRRLFDQLLTECHPTRLPLGCPEWCFCSTYWRERASDLASAACGTLTSADRGARPLVGADETVTVRHAGACDGTERSYRILRVVTHTVDRASAGRI
jgi:hypothetical protein